MRLLPVPATAALLAALAALAPAPSRAEVLRITVTNPQEAGGFAITPLWFGLHDGTFDEFDPGAAAYDDGNPATTDFPFMRPLAELGNPTDLGNAFMAAQPGGLAGVIASGGAVPPFLPGASQSLDLDVTDPSARRYLSFAAMVVPSNDLFVGNADPLAHPLFDGSGHFLGPITITLYGADVYDAGTEVNDVTNGPAFVVGQDATGGAFQGGVITPFLGSSGASDYLTSLIGVQTPTGTITHGFDRLTPIATISVRAVPEPSSVALAGLGIAGAIVALRAGRRRG